MDSGGGEEGGTEVDFRDNVGAGRKGEVSMVPSERTSKSPFGTLGDVGRERGSLGSKTGPIV
jgi:hypothetical protein